MVLTQNLLKPSNSHLTGGALRSTCTTGMKATNQVTTFSDLSPDNTPQMSTVNTTTEKRQATWP